MCFFKVKHIMDSISYFFFVFWLMQSYMSWYILSFFGFIFTSLIFFIFCCDQAALWMVQSVCLSVRLSVTPFWLCSHHRIIMKFSGVNTSDRGDVHTEGQGQRSKVKVTEVNTQLSHFWTVTPVWIHIWWWNDAYSLIMLRRGALVIQGHPSNFKVTRL